MTPVVSYSILAKRQPRLLASVSCVDGMLREQLSQDQLRLLQVIFEPFDRERGSPIWQFVDLTLDAKFGLDAAVVLDSLPVVGYHGPMSMSYGLTWREDSHLPPQPGTHVALTVAGLRYLRPATEPLLGSFLVTVRHMVDAQSKLTPDLRQVVEATVSSGSIMTEFAPWISKGARVEAMQRKVRWMLGHEPYLYNVVHQVRPQSIFKKIDCGLKVVPLVQPEVFDSGRASNARGVLRAPEWQRVHRHQVPPALPRTVAGIGQPDSQPSPLSTQRLSPNLRLL